MSGFWHTFSLSFLAAILLASGLGHALRQSIFRRHLREQRIISRSFSGAVSTAITALEISVGGFAASSIFRQERVWWEPALFGVSLACGAAFVFYLRRLLRLKGAFGTCGCLPVESVLTPVSLAPATGVIAVSAIGLAAFAIGPTALVLPVKALAAAWGVTLAGLLVLLPATMPTPLRTAK